MQTTELTCRELVELVTEYLGGTLPEPEQARFDAHLAECPYCQTYLEASGIHRSSARSAIRTGRR